MNPIETLGSRSAPGFLPLNLYATVATLGLLQRFGVLQLPGPASSFPSWVLELLLLFIWLSFSRTKFRTSTHLGRDSHFIRPPAAALLAYAAAAPLPRNGAGARPFSLVELLSLLRHKSQRTAAVNTTPEPFSNWI